MIDKGFDAVPVREIDKERRQLFIEAADQNLDRVVLSSDGRLMFKTDQLTADLSRVHFYDLVNDMSWDLNPDFQGITPTVLGETRKGNWMLTWKVDIGSGITADQRKEMPGDLGKIIAKKWWNKQKN